MSVKGLPPVFADHAVSVQFSASNALWHGLRQLGVKPGDKVLFPAYHCGAELDVCLKAGLEAIFYEVEPSLAIDWMAVRHLVDARTRMLFVIHYFGFPIELTHALDLCRDYGLALIEDCAHALYSRDAGNQACGQVGTMAVFSLRKFLPVPEGGALRLGMNTLSPDRPPAGETLRMLRFEARRSLSGEVMPITQRWMARVAGMVGMPFAAWHKFKGPRRFPRANDPSLEFSVLGSEWGMSPLSRWFVERIDHAAVIERRRQNFFELVSRLGNGGTVRPLVAALPEGVCPWLCPVLADNADQLIDHLRRRGIEAASLWRETHPRWPAEQFPAAGWLKQQVVALPVHQDLTLDHMRVVAQEVERWHGSA
jgi:dTDP-4-amino-4,6-dideoxygalactose transaminase